MYKKQRKEGVGIDLKPSKLELEIDLFLYIDYNVRLKTACFEDYLSFSGTRPWQSLLTLSWWRPLSYRSQSIDLRCKSMDWFLYDNGLRHERVKWKLLKVDLSTDFTVDIQSERLGILWRSILLRTYRQVYPFKNCWTTLF